MTKLSDQHREILDYITSFVTNMNPPSLNESKEAYMGAFENVMTFWFKTYNTQHTQESSHVIAKKILDNILRRDDDRAYNSRIRFIWNSRLKKMEDDLFPAGYADCFGGCEFRAFPVKERLLRIENRIGIITSPSEDLLRLEQCECVMRDILIVLRKITENVFATREDLFKMKPVTSLEGEFRRLEEKLGVNMTYANLKDRLQHLQDACECTNDPKFKTGDTFYILGREWKIMGINLLSKQYLLVPTIDCCYLDWWVAFDEVEGKYEISSRPPVKEEKK